MSYRVTILGAGVVGLSMAMLLSARRPDLSIRVIDRKLPAAPDDAISLRVSAISEASMRALEPVWPQVPDDRVCDYECMRVWDARDAADSASALRFSADEFAVARLGSIVENAALQQALLDHLADADVSVLGDTSVERIQEGEKALTLELADGGHIDTDLLIAADGANSSVRNLLGIETNRTDYSQVAIVTHLRPEKSHEATAWQRFLSSGPIALLPLRDGRVSTVWSIGIDEAEELLTLPAAELQKKISEASDYVLGELTIDGPVGHFPLVAHHAHSYVQSRVALIGDAAHVVHPMAGQGANLGIQDAVVLATLIDAAIAEGRHPGELRVLRRYQRRRREANATMLEGLTLLNRLFASESPFVSDLRRTGMALFNQSGPLRERTVRVALGDSLTESL